MKNSIQESNQTLMKTFVAKVVFQIKCETKNELGKFDEQFRLVRANNKEDAYEIVYSIAIKENENILSAAGQIIEWELVAITELFDLNEMKNGSEFYSWTQELQPADDYINFVNSRKELLLSKFNRLLKAS